MPAKTTKKQKPKNYMSNKEFLKEILVCQERNEISNKLGEMFTMLVNRYASKPNFSGYSYIDEMKGNAIVSCCQAFKVFDSSKSNNPFAFFTSVTHNAFLQILNKEKKQQRIRDEILVEDNKTPSFSYLEYANEKEQEEKVKNEEARLNNEYED